jgi:regulator of sigma E protease
MSFTFLSALLLFGFVIFIHELGHFLLAKVNGVKVLKFSLGFGPKIIGKKIGDTEYLISAFPLGGYVKMLGEDADEIIENSEKDKAYNNQPVHKRASIILAGPIFNILSAVVIFFFIYSIGIPVLLPVVGEVMPETPASRAMLLKGDRILEVDNKKVQYWEDVTEIIHRSANKPLKLKIQRGSEILILSITPEKKVVKDIFGEDKEIGLIGIKPSGETIKVKNDIFTSIKNAFLKTIDICIMTGIGIIKLIQRIIPADTIGGPIMILQIAEKQATTGALNFFAFAALISINLGILNLLPIPILDGGHLLFLSIEAIRKRPLSEKTMIIAQRIGLIFIISLMMFAFYNDILRILSGKPLP